jgi:hypothetical protein
LTREGLAGIGATVMRMAEAEGLHAHARAVAIRLEDMGVENMGMEDIGVEERGLDDK